MERLEGLHMVVFIFDYRLCVSAKKGMEAFMNMMQINTYYKEVEKTAAKQSNLTVESGLKIEDKLCEVPVKPIEKDIAASLSISKEGLSLAKQKVEEQQPEEAEEKRERDYSKYVVEKDIFEELDEKSAQFLEETTKGVQDLKVILESLGYELKKDKEEEKGQNALGSNEQSSMDEASFMESFAESQANHIVMEGFEKEQEIDNIVDGYRESTDKCKEHISENLDKIADLQEEIEKQKHILGKEDMQIYEQGQLKQISAFRSEIQDDRSEIIYNNTNIRDIRLERLKSQTMLKATNAAQDIQDAAARTARNMRVRSAITEDFVKPWDITVKEQEQEEQEEEK